MKARWFLQDWDFAKSYGPVMRGVLALISISAWLLLLGILSFIALQTIPFVGGYLEAHFTHREIGAGFYAVAAACLAFVFVRAWKS